MRFFALSLVALALVGCGSPAVDADEGEVGQTAAPLDRYRFPIDGPIYTLRYDGNASLPNVAAAYAAIPTQGVRIGASDGAMSGYPGFYSYRYSSSQPFLFESGSHFEGLGRLPSGHLVASGNERGELMVVDLASRRRSSGRFGANRTTGLPPAGDGFVGVNGAASVVLGHDGYTHLGGLSVIGTYVAVGLEREGDSGSDSYVHLVDFANPTAPRVIPGATLYNPATTAGAIAIAKRADGTFFMAVGGWGSGTIRFYASTTTDIENPGWSLVRSWTRGECINDVSGDGTCFAAHQNLNFVTQSDGSLFMLGTNRNGSGEDWIDLFAVRDVGPWLSVHKIGKKHMTCTDGCNFNAGAGTFVDGGTGSIYVYATEWRRSTLSRYYAGGGPLFLRMNEM